MKFATGVGAFTALMAFDLPGGPVLVLAFACATLIAVPLTSDRRGLSGVVSGLPARLQGSVDNPGARP